ncbi:MAG: hypothetical protein GX767_04240 [Firmicutes bacterium]|nr:hypothetical protein [Bacillota bacterium]
MKAEGKESIKYFKEKGRRALILNIIFAVVFFLGIFLVTITGFAPVAIIIFLIFIASMVYFYRK